ncbi:MAG: PAS domain S-box protein, partial [Bacteroidales bacterium]
MIGQTCHHFWADPSKPCENCPSLKALETKKTENTIIQTIDGRIWEERGEPIFDAQGNLLGVVEIATDISERKQAENENERTQKLLEDSQRIGKIGGWEMNIDRGELKWTREMYNIHEVDATFKPNLDKRGNFYTPESLPVIDKAVQRAIEFGEPYEVDLEIITAKGNKRSIKTIGKADLENRRVFGLFQDITERKLTELALKKSELELKKAQQITHIGSWYLDLATNEVNWSEELYKMYGFDASLPPPPYTEHKKLFTPESWEILSSSLAHTSETGIPYELELKTIKHDGTNGWMWVRGETIKDSDNQTIGLWGAAQDISEHKYIEQILKESEEKYRLLTEFTADVVWVLNLASGKFSYISPSVFQLRGFTAEEAMLETLESALTPESITIVNNAIAKNVVTFIAQPEFPNHYINEIQQYCKNGEIIWVEVSTQFRYSPSGDIEVVGVSRNIENRKKAEETLRKSEIMLREAGKLAKLGGWEIDLATNKLTWTEETYNIHEVPLGNSPQLEDGIRFYAPEAQPILNKAIDRAINHGEPFDLELPFITAKGNHLWVRSIGNVEHMNGIASRLYGVFQDITERKQTEKALRENEEKYRTLVENSLVGVVQ